VSLIKSKGVFVTAMLGLGDLIVCLGIFQELSKKHNFCVVPVTKSYQRSLRSLLGQNSNIYISSFIDSKANALLLRQRQVMSALGSNVVDLGFFGKNWLEDTNKKFDEQMYDQAGVDFKYRWKNFAPLRNYENEQKLFNSYGVEKGKYAFLHEDTSRGMVINRNFVDPTLKIVESNPKYSRNSITDYMYLLENAGEIHTIESSFAALIESMQLNVLKFTHRYARLKVVKNPSVQFTYKSDWVILN
jgi:hypothetical protein